MEALARAGIDITGNVLRYAEVEQSGREFRLLRLGSCDFDFDVAEALWQPEAHPHLPTVSEALADVFAGSGAVRYQLTVHPPGCYSFFTPLPSGISETTRKVRIQQEASLLAGVETPLRLMADPAYSDAAEGAERVDWVHVLAVPEHVYTRFEEVLRVLVEQPHPRLTPRPRLMASMQAAAAAMEHLLHRALPGPDAPFALAVGWYPTHVEYTLCRGAQWYYSHFTVAGTPADAVYYGVALLQRLHLRPSQVGRVYLYGITPPAETAPILERVFSRPAERLNPLAVVDLDADSLTEDFDAVAYVPCMGAAL